MKGKFIYCRIKAFLRSFCLFTLQGPKWLLQALFCKLEPSQLVTSHGFSLHKTIYYLLQRLKHLIIFHRNKQTLVLPEVPWSLGLQDASHHQPEQLPSATPSCALGLASLYSHAATLSEQPAENCCWIPMRFCLFVSVNETQARHLPSLRKFEFEIIMI